MLAANFDFTLPTPLMAQKPAKKRDLSRLLVLTRGTGAIEHTRFSDFPHFLAPGDILVLNDSKVFPARLFGKNLKSDGKFELLLLSEVRTNEWWAMLRPGKRAKSGTQITLTGTKSTILATVIDQNAEGHRLVQFSGTADIKEELDAIGKVPLPPYIRRNEEDDVVDDLARYQTVYAKHLGSIAAPTAGLHFTPSLLDAIRARGIHVCFVTLHVGLGTFAPVKAVRLEDHVMHEEQFELNEHTVQTIEWGKAVGARICAVGTTSVRVLESVAAQNAGTLKSGRGKTQIFIYPPYRFRMVDALLTNFHLPRSTLLMLASAFTSPGKENGRKLLLSAYQQAIEAKYRFFSYGDAMLIR